MPKLKLQYFGHLTRTDNSLEKPLMLGKIRGRRRGHQRMRWLDGITDTINMNLGKLREMVKDWEVWHAAVHGVPKSPTWLLCLWGFSKKEYWSGLPSPSPGDLPDSGVEPASRVCPALAGGSLPLAPPGSSQNKEECLCTCHQREINISILISKRNVHVVLHGWH